MELQVNAQAILIQLSQQRNAALDENAGLKAALVEREATIADLEAKLKELTTDTKEPA